MKKKLIYVTVLFLFLLGIPSALAKPETKNREEIDNYGVNKKWEITDRNKNNVLQTPLVDASEKIYDFEDVLTESEKEELKELVDEFIKKTNMDMAIVISNFSYVSDEENENYAADFYDYNDFGIDLKDYSGVLFLRNTYEVDPYFNIYTFGEAQIMFSYNRLESILDDIFPDIKNKNYKEGLSSFIHQMTSYYEKGIPSEMRDYYIDEMGYLQVDRKFHPSWLIYLIISTIVTAIIMGILIGKNKMVVKVKTAEEYINKNSIDINNRKDVFVSSHTSSYTTSSSSGGGGGFSSSGGSSGGGHSSGGGRHG
ncbi:MAG: TPM domain-containing protein [Bacilli bacterium]|nr:TPM domain-containing protein [Bacilli bacterium]